MFELWLHKLRVIILSCRAWSPPDSVYNIAWPEPKLFPMNKPSRHPTCIHLFKIYWFRHYLSHYDVDFLNKRTAANSIVYIHSLARTGTRLINDIYARYTQQRRGKRFLLFFAVILSAVCAAFDRRQRQHE